MEIIKWKDFIKQKEYFVRQAEKNKFFIYPTDSIYGIWAIYSQKNIEKISKIKNRDPKKPISIIAPNWSWIDFNFDVDIKLLKSQFKKNNPCTFILETKPNFDLPNFNNSLGIRIINHPFQNFVDQLWQGFITTSANLAGEKNIIDINDIDDNIISKIDFVISNWKLNNSPSTLIDTINKKIIKR